MKTKDTIVALFFIIVSACIFLPMFISDKLFTWLDFMYYFMPFRELTAEIIKSGNVPLWNPYIFCGNPLMANMQSAVFYPLNVLYYVLPFAAAVKLQTLLAFFIASFSMYGLARSYKTSRLAAMLAGSVFAFGFYMTVRAVEMADLHVIIWIPAILLMARRYAFFNKLHDLFLLVLCLSMSFLGGHPQVFSYAFILFTAFFMFESTGTGSGIGKAARKYLLVCLMLSLFILVQLLPTVEFIARSKRAAEGVGVNVHLSTFAGIEQVISFFFPFMAKRLGSDALFLNWMALIDIGIPSVLLFIAGAILMKRGRLKIFLFSIFAAAAVTAFAGNFRFYESLLNALPALGAIEYVSKINIICVVIIALLVSFGFDALINGGQGDGHREKITKTFLIISCVMALAWLLTHVFYRQAGSFYAAVIAGPKAAGSFAEFTKDVNVYAVLFVFFTVVLMLLVLRRINPKTAGFAVFGLAFAAIFSYHTAGYDSYSKEWAFFEDTENIAMLKKQPGISSARIMAPYLFKRPDYSVVTKNTEAKVYYLRDSLFPNIPMQERLHNADGFDSLVIASFEDVTKKLKGMETPWDNPAFSILSAEYIASRPKLSGKYIKLIAEGYSNIYRYKKAMPLVYFVSGGPAGQIIFSDDKNEIISGITSDGFNPAKRLYIEKNAKAKLRGARVFPGKNSADISFTRKNTNSIDITAYSWQDGAIVVTDNYYPGWKAWVNGVKTQVYRANHAFKAIPVKKGENEIRLVFDPAGFKAAFIISVLVMFLSLLPVLGYVRQSK